MSDNLIVVGEARFLFPKLFKPEHFVDARTGRKSEKAYYSLTLLLKPDAPCVAELAAKFSEVALAKWPGRNLQEDIQYNRFNWPLTPGAQAKAAADKTAADKGKEGRDTSFYDNVIVLKTNSIFPPGVYDANRKPVLDQNQVYSGCYGYAELNLTSYDGVGNGSDGVKAYLNMVMKTRDGDKVASGGRSAEEAFAGITGQAMQQNPMAGMPGAPGVTGGPYDGSQF